MRNDRGRVLVSETAALARERGIQTNIHFNVVDHELETIHGLYAVLALAVSRSEYGASRGDRRDGRKVAHAIRNALLDLKQDDSAIDAWLARPGPRPPEGVRDWTSFAEWVQERMWEVALGGDGLNTQRRAVRDVRALGRLLNALARRGFEAPIERSPASVARSRARPARVGSGEGQEGSIWLAEKDVVGDEEERSESEEGVGSADPTRPRATEARGDGWDG